VLTTAEHLKSVGSSVSPKAAHAVSIALAAQNAAQDKTKPHANFFTLFILLLQLNFEYEDEEVRKLIVLPPPLKILLISDAFIIYSLYEVRSILSKSIPKVHAHT
jgi:hypothetical protein